MIDTCFYLYQCNISRVYHKKIHQFAKTRLQLYGRSLMYSTAHSCWLIIGHVAISRSMTVSSTKWNKIRRTLVPPLCGSENDATQESVINFAFLYETEAYDNIVTHGGVIVLSHSRAPNLTWTTVSIWMFQQTSVSRNNGIRGETKLFPKKPIHYSVEC